MSAGRPKARRFVVKRDDIPLTIMKMASVLGLHHGYIREWAVGTGDNKCLEMPEQYYNKLVEFMRQPIVPVRVID